VGVGYGMNREEAKINCNLDFTGYLIRNGFLAQNEAPKLNHGIIRLNESWTTDYRSSSNKIPEILKFDNLCAELEKIPIYKFTKINETICAHVDEKSILTVNLVSKCEVGFHLK
jgi:hypothetical protein